MYDMKQKKSIGRHMKKEIIDTTATPYSAFFFDLLESVVKAVIVGVLLMSFVFRIVNVSGTSMLETLHDSDMVVVLKCNYTPKSGDVVIITRGKNLDEPLIKRVIATEGQTLEIDFSEGTVKVNGIKLNETYIKERMWLQGDGEIPNTIPQGYSFVMGDNRNHSMDSRFASVGLIKNENVAGKASFVVFPFERIGAIR